MTTTSPQSLSLKALRRAWSGLAAPALTDFEGDFQASFVGGPLRTIAPRGLALAGLPRWYGKRFAPAAEPGADVLQGVNLLTARDGAGLEETLPMTATIGASLADGSPAVIVTYPAGGTDAVALGARRVPRLERRRVTQHDVSRHDVRRPPGGTAYSRHPLRTHPRRRGGMTRRLPMQGACRISVQNRIPAPLTIGGSGIAELR